MTTIQTTSEINEKSTQKNNYTKSFLGFSLLAAVAVSSSLAYFKYRDASSSQREDMNKIFSSNVQFMHLKEVYGDNELSELEKFGSFVNKYELPP